MPRSLVCGVDDAADARSVVTVAARLAQRLGLPLILVHVTPGAGAGLTPYPVAGDSTFVAAPAPTVPYPAVPPDATDLDAARQRGDRMLAKVAADCGVTGAHLRAEPAADPADALRRVAADEDAELLVVGSRGRGPVKSTLLGSTSWELTAHAPCPVVVVPPEVGARAAGSRSG